MVSISDAYNSDRAHNLVASWLNQTKNPDACTDWTGKQAHEESKKVFGVGNHPEANYDPTVEAPDTCDQLSPQLASFYEQHQCNHPKDINSKCSASRASTKPDVSAAYDPTSTLLIAVIGIGCIGGIYYMYK